MLTINSTVIVGADQNKLTTFNLNLMGNCALDDDVNPFQCY